MKYLSVVLLLLLSVSLFAQEINDPLITGNFYLDTQLQLRENHFPTEDSLNIMTQNKSVPLSGAMSLVIPGAGQFYNEDYWKAGAFLLVEAAAIATAIIYEGKGDDQTEHFESIANQHWSVNQYADWSMDNAQRINNAISDERLEQYRATMYNEENVVNWHILNDLEHDIGRWYSHRLAPYGDQQYYEMIGKYRQFNSGWSDFYDMYPDGNFTYPDDPATDRFLSYSSERAKANDYYSVSKTAITVLIINHIASAVEAMLTTNSRNKSVDVSASLEKHNFGYVTNFYPQVNVKYTF